MNQHYDCTRAKKALEQIYKDRLAGVASSIPQLTRIKADDIVFEPVAYPPSMRIMTQEEDEHTEVVSRIQGVLCASTLPPYRRTPAGTSLANIRKLRQCVKIAPFGATGFDEACKVPQTVSNQLQAQTGGERVTPFNFLPYEGNACIDAHARYFTDRNLVPFEKNLPFEQHVDPFSILSNLKPEVFIHGPDNSVDYIKRTADRNGCTRYIPYDPSAFKAGGVVEVAFSFVGVPIKEKRRLLYLNLKALTLDDTIRKESELHAIQITPPPAPVKIQSFKRRTGYVDWDHPEEDTNKRRGAEDVEAPGDLNHDTNGDERTLDVGNEGGAEATRREAANSQMNVD